VADNWADASYKSLNYDNWDSETIEQLLESTTLYSANEPDG
jgi:hypothetical protein